MASLTSACTAISHVHRPRAGQPDRPPRPSARSAPACAAPTAPRPAACPPLADRRDPPDHHRDRPQHRRSVPATPRSSCSATPPHCAARAAALTLADLEPKPGGLLLHIRRSKTDQEAPARSSASPTATTTTDPVAALNAWLAAAPIPAAVHPPLGRRLRPPALGTSCPGCSTPAPTPPDSRHRITGHSLRAGHATAAALAGVPLDRIAAQTRHRTSPSSQPLHPPPRALATTSSRDLGL